MYVFRTFGFATALEIAQQAMCCAHVEAKGAPNCIGLVKLMGRDAGFIAAGATLASQEVNFCLVPEIAFPLDGPNGFLPALKERILQEQARRDRRRRRRRPAPLQRAERLLRRLRQQALPGHRHLPPRQDLRVLQAGKHPDLAQVHRPQLPHPQRAGQHRRPPAQRPDGPLRRPQRDGRQHRRA